MGLSPVSPKGGAPEGWGPEGWEGAQNFALFSLSRHNFLPSSSLGGLFVEFWWCLKCWALQCARLEFLGCRVEAPAAPKAAGRERETQETARTLVTVLHTTARELQTCTFQGPGISKHHQNSTRRLQEKREERMNIVVGEVKKERNFGRSGGGRGLAEGPRRVGHKGGALQWCPECLQGVGLLVFGVYGFWVLWFEKIWPNQRNNKFGQSRFGQSRFGQSRP